MIPPGDRLPEGFFSLKKSKAPEGSFGGCRDEPVQWVSGGYARPNARMVSVV